jgi:hypothetical protein
MTKTTIAPGLIEAYKTTQYRIADTRGGGLVVCEIGKPNREVGRFLRRWNGDSGWFVTAHNPGSQRRAEADNHRGHGVLRGLLRMKGVLFTEATAIDPAGEWPEEDGFVVVVPESRLGVGGKKIEPVEAMIRAIATELGQNAIVKILNSGEGELVLLA